MHTASLLQNAIPKWEAQHKVAARFCLAENHAGLGAAPQAMAKFTKSAPLVSWTLSIQNLWVFFFTPTPSWICTRNELSPLYVAFVFMEAGIYCFIDPLELAVFIYILRNLEGEVSQVMTNNQRARELSKNMMSLSIVGLPTLVSNLHNEYNTLGPYIFCGILNYIRP